MLLFLFLSYMFMISSIIYFIGISSSKTLFLIHMNMITNLLVYSTNNNYLLFNYNMYMLLFLSMSILLLLFTTFGLMFNYDLTILNMLMLFIICFYSFFTIVFILIVYLDGMIYSHLLVGDVFMDVLFASFLLCTLESFSYLCSCLSLFMSMFCNLLSSHFLLLLFTDFVYFYIIFMLMMLLTMFSIMMNNLMIILLIMFYLSLMTLDMFASMLQMFMLLNMLFMSLNDFLYNSTY